ncbi:SRPBCC family protein [Bradyrhizobium japonicum]|uniref:SRPBCC family protein n=1 Tax=Bradyrhizobium japonicum TaxID=375 RepID=UPI001FDA0387|nr:SRPBCC family protein [Bradyrhizobium japonicum]
MGFARASSQPQRVTETEGEPPMTRAYYSAVLDHPLDEVWSLIRDFHNYPAYIDGVSESVIEDDKRGDEVGAIRRFCYLGNWIRQRLVDHSDRQHTLAYAGLEALPYPQDDGSRSPAPTHYQGTMHLRPVIEGNRTLIEWSVALDSEPADAERWQALFASWIPDWTDSLARTLARAHPRSS